MIDRAKFGEAVAKTLDRLETMIEVGEIEEEFEITNVLVVVVLERPMEEAEYDGEIEELIFCDGTTQSPATQRGILLNASDVVSQVS